MSLIHISRPDTFFQKNILFPALLVGASFGFLFGNFIVGPIIFVIRLVDRGWLKSYLGATRERIFSGLTFAVVGFLFCLIYSYAENKDYKKGLGAWS